MPHWQCSQPVRVTFDSVHTHTVPSAAGSYSGVPRPVITSCLTHHPTARSKSVPLGRDACQSYMAYAKLGLWVRAGDGKWEGTRTDSRCSVKDCL
eukprot:scaffold67052_cov27-Tisochrysis_lutea.AAC.1